MRKRWRLLLWMQGNQCPLCGGPLDVCPQGREGPPRLDLDHIVPTSRGGGNGLCNLQITHRWCNSRKGQDEEGPRREGPQPEDCPHDATYGRWCRGCVGEEPWLSGPGSPRGPGPRPGMPSPLSERALLAARYVPAGRRGG